MDNTDTRKTMLSPEGENDSLGNEISPYGACDAVPACEDGSTDGAPDALSEDSAYAADSATDETLAAAPDAGDAPVSKKKKVFRAFKFYLFLAALSVVWAVADYVFIVPNAFAPGGLNGVSSLIYNAVLPFNQHLADTVFSPAVTGMVLNVPLLVAAFILLHNKKFTFDTLYCVAVHSIFMAVFDLIDGFPKYYAGSYESGYMLLASLAGGAISGLSLGLMLRFNASRGGTDIIGKLIYAKNPISSVHWLIFMCDCVIVIASGGLAFIDMDYSAGSDAVITAVLSPILYSFLSLVATSQVADVIQSGFQASIVFNVISDHHDAIAEEITRKLHRGVTVTDGIGYYTGKQHKVLVCVVRKKQINEVKHIIQKKDPAAFIYITKAREVNGYGFAPLKSDD